MHPFHWLGFVRRARESTIFNLDRQACARLSKHDSFLNTVFSIVSLLSVD
jgi:hypothetical protein